MDLRSQELFHFCPRCGTQNNKREVFCSFCRLPLSHFITYPVWQIEKTLQQQNISVPFKPPPIMLGHNIDTDKDIFITDTARTSGMYVIGGTRVGKSTLLTGVF